MCKHIKFYASLRAESKLITLQSEFVIFSFLQPEQNVRMIYLSKYDLLLIPIQLAVSTFLQLEILMQTHHGFNG